jgi:hypothetical protein
VQIANPTPGGSQPAIAYNDIYRRVSTDTGAGIRIATNVGNNATFDDWKVAAGVNYAYQVTAFGVNGTSTAGSFAT